MRRVSAALFALTFCVAADLPEPATDTDFRRYDPALVRLGQVLFYDRVLSPSRTVSCGTCHNHDRATSNGVRLDGQVPQPDGMAVDNLDAYLARNPNADHAPALFNLGAKEFTRLFRDGRLREGKDGAPVADGIALPAGLADVLAAQALMPAVTPGELAAHGPLTDHASLWRELEERVQDLEGYKPLFQEAFPDEEWPEAVTITRIGNAIGAFVGTEWRADDAPFDRLLKGDEDSLTDVQKRGMSVFYGEGRCAECHSGPFQTDHGFHRVDDGAAQRTPSLRNISATAPYGSDGSAETMRAFIVEHVAAGGDMPSDVGLAGSEMDDLVSFLGSLTDAASLRGRLGKPDSVPSNLEMD